MEDRKKELENELEKIESEQTEIYNVLWRLEHYRKLPNVNKKYKNLKEKHYNLQNRIYKIQEELNAYKELDKVERKYNLN